MAEITGILCQVITGNVSGAGTDGSIYLGLGGREFHLDSSQDDFERGSWREYILGRAPLEPNLPPPQIRVTDKDHNDPRRDFRLDTVNLNRTPVYIRFEPENNGDNWNLKFAAVLVYSGQGQFVVAFTLPRDFDNLWLGHSMGKIIYLTNEWWSGAEAVLALGRQVSSTMETSTEENTTAPA
ncbi:MAG TPA: hypothetical protein VFI42_08410 [Thermomicrobiaceae bacterium]|nr:hypothetical protein [Thermomicrobiaceae bacterium]